MRPAGQPAVRAEHQPAVVDRLDEQLLELPDPVGDVAHVRVVGQQVDVLVAQREDAATARSRRSASRGSAPAQSGGREVAGLSSASSSMPLEMLARPQQPLLCQPHR